MQLLANSVFTVFFLFYLKCHIAPKTVMEKKTGIRRLAQNQHDYFHLANLSPIVFRSLCIKRWLFSESNAIVDMLILVFFVSPPACRPKRCYWFYIWGCLFILMSLYIAFPFSCERVAVFLVLGFGGRPLWGQSHNQ